VAITDPGTKLEAIAKEQKFRRCFLNPPDIGGRYSALSYFGLVPAALIGVDIACVLDRAIRMMHSSAGCLRVEENVGVSLGGAIGALKKAGRDKITFIVSPRICAFGLWVEQLIAESTGKEGTGLIPVCDEPLVDSKYYGKDRVFAFLKLKGSGDLAQDAAFEALRKAGVPTVMISVADRIDVGEEFMRWEIATATAGAVIGIDPFDQPNVQESKDNTKHFLEVYKKNGSLPDQELGAEGHGLKAYCDAETIAELGSGSSFEGFVTAHLSRAHAGDYIAMLDYFQETSEHEEMIQSIRTHLRDALHVATTTGYGPRFLHSTGQLHKGGPPSGVFIQVTADNAVDVPLPNEAFTFGVLKQAQALGDFQSLASRHRRAIRVHLGKDVAAGLRTLLEIIQNAFPVVQGQAR
jgi:transaldolase/glucose-6-phosphate isomerase